MRTRLVLVSTVLAVVLLAAACGGGDDSTEDSEGTTETVDRSDATESDPAGQPEQADSAADIEQAAEPEPALAPSRLGNRFEWCVRTQATWDAFDDSFAALREAEAQVRHAMDAVAAATDELDRAEAQEAVDDARRTLTDAQDRFDSAYWQALHNDLALAYRLHTDGSGDSRSVAYGRGWVAFVANADSATAEAAASVESELASYEAARVAADAAMARSQAALDAAVATADEAWLAFDAARRELDRALEIADSHPHLGEAVGEAWADAQAVVAAVRSRDGKDNDTLFALQAYDAGYTGMLAAGTLWNSLYKANSSDHVALTEALADLTASQDEAIAALAEVDAAASDAITEALAAHRAVGPTVRETYTALRVWQAEVGVTEELVQAAEEAHRETSRDPQVQADYGPVREAEDAMAVYLAEEMLGGAAYTAFRASLQESCEP